jgi:MFS family permease
MVFRTAHFQHPTVLAVAMAVFQQLTGINTVIFYSTGILQECGVKSPIYATVLVGAVNVLFTVLSAYLMDRAGRKALLVMSHAGCFVSLSVLTGAIYFEGEPRSLCH